VSISPEVFLPRFDADGGLEPPCAEWPDLDRLEPTGIARFLREALDCMDDDVRDAGDGRQDLNLRHLGPERAAETSDGPIVP
jgi:hypothetical protein